MSQQEKKILGLIIRGLNGGIRSELYISGDTVKTHRRNNIQFSKCKCSIIKYFS
ncbi:hypothetical protein AB6805_05025 [Chitinophaga sp. RCC_12]|uniref:LuxR C-terminal-related transcriptional regulator n=1 Tax=Chitinophaga sp. RCC_12 TaxID=3239226 RepID=UPI003523497D